MELFSIYTCLNNGGQVTASNLFGEFSKNNNLIKISYQSVEDGNATLTTLFISKNQVRLSRKGQVNYTCILSENVSTDFEINVDNFRLNATLFCYKINIEETSEYFKLTLNYDVIMGETTNNEYYVEVKKGGNLC